jgi:DNA polymerase-3 subunit alpha
MDHGLGIERQTQRTCCGWPRTSGCRCWPPTTCTTPRPRTPRRTRRCCACSPARRSWTRAASSSTPRSSTSSRRRRCATCSASCPRRATTRCCIAEQCEVSFTEEEGRYMPRFPCPAGETRRPGSSRRSSGAAQALPRRASRRSAPEQADFEIEVIIGKGYPATSSSSPTSSTGPRTTASGSARAAARVPGSMCAYAMGITDLDPIVARPDLRALPQPRAALDARLRRRLRRAPPRRGDPLRHGEVRRRSGRPDRHLRHHQGQAGGQGRRPGAGHPVRHGREAHQGHAADVMGKGMPLRASSTRALPLRRGRRLPQADPRVEDPQAAEVVATASASRASSASGACTPPA